MKKKLTQLISKPYKYFSVAAILQFVLFFIFFAPNWCQAQNVNIPNSRFKNALLANTAINTNADGAIQMSEAVAYNGGIDIPNLGVTDLTGLEAFTAITSLDCSGNGLTSLNVSANTKLIYLNCPHNSISSLDLSVNTTLRGLDCSFNSLTNINVSSNLALFQLLCSHNSLSSLNLSANLAFADLNCSYNSISSLNLSVNTELNRLECANNLISNLDLSENTKLGYLECSGNPIHSLDISTNVNLYWLYCRGNLLTSLNLSSNTALTNLSCEFNSITNLDLSANTALQSLGCGFNLLTTLDLPAEPNLNNLGCEHNSIQSLNLDSLPHLSYLECSQNKLTSLHISNNPILAYVIANHNNLTSIIADTTYDNPMTIDISYNQFNSFDFSVFPTAATSINCSYNQLTTIDFSAFPTATSIDCSYNQLTTIDFSSNTSLTYFNATGQKGGSLTSLNIKNGNNTTLSSFFADNNPNLSCIQVDDVPYAHLQAGNGSWGVEAGAAISTDCSVCYVKIPDPGFKAYLVASAIDTDGDEEITCAEAAAYTGAVNYGNITGADITGIEAFTSISSLTAVGVITSNLVLPVSPNLYNVTLSDGYIGHMDVSKLPSLGHLTCSQTSLQDLDVSHNPLLAYLECNGTAVSNLDLSHNPELSFLRCSDNYNITSLDLSANPKLATLLFDNCSLSNIDLSNNPNLMTLSCWGNQLINLDLTANPSLSSLNCGRNSLTALNLQNNPNLSFLSCSYNQLTDIDLSGNPQLIALDCSNNFLTKLNLKNRVNTNQFSSFAAQDNPDLACVQVDDTAYANANLMWYIAFNPLASFSTDCHFCNTTSSTTHVSICPAALPYVWNGFTFTTSDTQTIHLTNAAGCDSVATLVLTVKTNSASITNIAACKSFVWNGTTYSTSGTYTFATTNATGCDSLATLILRISKTLYSFAKTDALCYGSATGSTTISASGGIAPYVYRLGTTGNYQPSNTFTNLKAGNYRVYILDSAGCVTPSATINISQLPPINISFTKTNVSCYGTATGSLAVSCANGVAPYNYRISISNSAFQLSNTFSNLKAGTYRVYVQDARGCTATSANIVISQPLPLGATYTTTDANCYGTATGSINASGINGTIPYTYRLGASGSYNVASSFSNLKGASYRIYIKDSKGCVGNTTAVVNQPLPVTVSYNKTDPTCVTPTGSVTVIKTGASVNLPYTYKIGSTAYVPDNVFSGLKAGTYYGYVKDAGGCIGRSAPIVLLPATGCFSFAKVSNSNNKDGKLPFEVSIYPNPSGNLFNLIAHSNSPLPVNIKVLDAMGRSVYIVKGNAEQPFRFGEKLPNGLYLVEVKQGDEVKTVKALKHKE